MEATTMPWQLKFISKLQAYLSAKKYEFLLFSFLVLIFGNTFGTGHRAVAVFDIYQNMLIGLVFFYNKKWLRLFILYIILMDISLDVFEADLTFLDIKSWHGILYLVFFFLVSKEVYKEVFYAKKITRELLAAAMCGFVLLCLIATFLFYQIDIKIPGSFTNTGTKKEILTNLNYFSFTTLLTTGYGDITPVSLVAKRAVMLMGLAGHFYTVFITSIIIGKYLSANKS